MVDIHIMERLSPTKRNEHIRELLKKGKVPMLPFEAIVLEERLGLLKEKQGNLSSLLRRSMEDSSETWHDNAPAEAIANESKVVFAQAHKALAAQYNSEIVSYPPESLKQATLGSLVAVSFGGDAEQECVLLTGSVRELHKEIAKSLPTDTACATLGSPLGKALFDSTAGNTVSYRAGKRDVQVQVHQIAQLSPSLM